jgi:hypothetical protein
VFVQRPVALALGGVLLAVWLVPPLLRGLRRLRHGAARVVPSGV